VIGFSIASVDVSAHMGGLIVGFIGRFMLSKNPKFIVLYSSLMFLVTVAIAYYLPSQYAQMLF
jgi:rhomboid protease GluP